MRFLVLVWMAWATAGLGYSQQVEPLLFAEKIHDFGEITETGGNAQYDFTFTNNAGRPVRIINVQPSCGCTTPDWTKETIATGKTGFIKVIFDPRGKPGYFNKSLTVTTDLDGNSINLQIKGQIVAAAKSVEDTYTADHGNLKLKSNSFNLARVFINQNPVTMEFDMYNAGKNTIHFTEKPLAPSHIKVTIPELLEPKQKGKIKITYNAKLKNQYGFVSDNIELITDDEHHQRKSFSVYATIEEYFPLVSGSELSTVPLLQTELTTIDLGRTTSGVTMNGELKIKNAGKKDLVIHTVQPNCSCLEVQTEKMVLKGGEQTKIKLSLHGQGRTGTLQKAITLYSTDPINPVQRVTVMGYIEE